MPKHDITRRNFVEKGSYLAGLAVLGSSRLPPFLITDAHQKNHMVEKSLIGNYGNWAAEIVGDAPTHFSFRKDEYTSLRSWKSLVRRIVIDRLAAPDTMAAPQARVDKTYEYDGLHVEELSWSLPYGPITKAILLKPADAAGPLPGILALHDHGGNKYFGRRKITKTDDRQHSLMTTHQKNYYEGNAWANEIAKRGYVVLVSDAFTFASRRVLLQDVPEQIREGLSDNNPEDPNNISAYNDWAGRHEHIMAKSLFSAGTTWPGVFLTEDQRALDVLARRDDVLADQLGCAGLSGGGLRTAMLGGLDERIKCAVCVGFMTTWRDFLLHKSYTHTWMSYIPLLPRELDFPEIFGMRVPLPTMVLNDEDDDLFTLPEMKRADQILQQVFDKADAGDRYRCSFYPGPHKFDQAMQEEAFSWFDQWLKD